MQTSETKRVANSSSSDNPLTTAKRQTSDSIVIKRDPRCSTSSLGDSEGGDVIIQRLPSSDEEEDMVVESQGDDLVHAGKQEADFELDDSEADGIPDIQHDALDLSHIKDMSIVHMTKKNLMFELEYVQTVCQSLDIRMSTSFGQYSKSIKIPKMQQESIASLGAGGVVRFNQKVEVEEEKGSASAIKYVDNQDGAQRKMRVYLEQVYQKLSNMKKEYLRDDSMLTRDELKKHLITMACYIERTRLYLDNYIYPRDFSLNLIDIQIEDKTKVERKKAMHLTERLYNIVYKDFFSAYEKSVLFHSKIQKLTGKDIEEQEIQEDGEDQKRISVMLEQDILEDDRESIMMTSQDLEGNKMNKDAEDAKKHISKKQGGVNQDMRGMIKILNGFYPNLPAYGNVEEIMDLELTFVIKLKSVPMNYHEILMTLYAENGQPFSLTVNYDLQQIQALQFQDQNFFFVNIPLRALLLNNLALIIKFVEKRKGKGACPTANILQSSQFEQPYYNKFYKGYTILPISKLFWVQQLRVKQIYEIKEAQIYKPMPGSQIEEKYATLIEKRGFKKYKDLQLTQFFNMSYQYMMEVKMKEDQIPKRPNFRIVKNVNFDTQLLSTKDSETGSYLKSRVDKYRFNDLKIDLINLMVSEATQKKSPVVRIEVALMDNYGVVYDTVYRTIVSDNQNGFHFMQTYESSLYSTDLPDRDIRLGSEGFFIRIPTKSLDTLKKIYLLFMVQTLVNPKDSKGNKIKSSNFQSDMDSLLFRTEMVAVLPLYDFQDNCIIKNKITHLDLLQIENVTKPIPTKFEYFRQVSSVSNLRPAVGERLNINLRLISNEFTHNTYINNLLLIKDSASVEQEVEVILKSLKNLKETNDQILFHDKILDKLFQLSANNFKYSMDQGSNADAIGDLIFETIISIIDVFQNRFQDYKDILENYISKHFAHAKVYKPLLAQIDKMSLRIKGGLTESNQNEEKNAYVLMTMKYLGIILKIVRNSFLEAQSCMDENFERDNSVNLQAKHGGGNGGQGMANKSGTMNSNNDESFFHAQKIEMMYRKSMIAEVDEESDEEDIINRNQNRQTTRKGAIRHAAGAEVSMLIDPENPERHLTKREFGITIQKSLRNIFEGCHKDDMKTTLSLRAILYENITQIFENITDFMDDQFLQSVLRYIYDEAHSRMVRSVGNNAAAQSMQQNSKEEGKSNFKSNSKPLQGIMKKKQDDNYSMQSGKSKDTRRSEIQSIGGQEITLDFDYITNERNLRSLQDWNWVSEEAITKLKIIAMGKLLQHGIFDKVQGDTNKVVMAFCENIERHHMKRPELYLHVFYFLYQLFQYLKSPDDFSDEDDLLSSSNQRQGGNKKLQIFSKSSLDLRDFFTKILPEVSSNLMDLFKDSNIEDKVKAAKLPDEALKPFKEKASLVFLSIANSLTKDKIKVIIFNEPKKLAGFVKTLKKLSNKITFAEPYQIFFEKKKVQVLRKLIECIIQIFMEQDPASLGVEYHQTIFQCRLMMIYLWNKLAKIKLDYKSTMRSKNQVKDQLKVHKGKMLETFTNFWHKFKGVGQPWKSIKGSMSKQFQNFIKLSSDKAIRLFMLVVSDTLSLEYKETKDIFETCNSVFKVFYELHGVQSNKQDELRGMFPQKELAQRFLEAFEKTMTDDNELFKSDQGFQDQVKKRFQNMKMLSQSIHHVTLSKVVMKDNLFYRAYCMTQLIEVLWELKLFKLFLENRESFESLNLKLGNNLEVAFTYLRFVESMDHQAEDDRVLIGQKEIFAHIQLTNLKRVQKFFEKAEFYEMAIDILNKQKNIAENMLFDFELVSQIVKSQYKIYKTLAMDTNRYFAVYFKIGFFGQSFPEMFKNREFIYRGSRLVRRGDVKENIQKFFPDAYMLDYSSFPEKAVLEGDKKSLQIQRVDPLTYLEIKDFDKTSQTKDVEELELGKKAKDLPSKLRTYYLENFKNKFYKQTLIASNNGDEELQRDRLIEIFVVKNKFPTIFNMQEIYKTKKFTRHAIDEAIRNVQMIIETIEQFKKQAIQSEDASDFESLTSQIRAALESPIQGGVIKYINTFINDQSLRGPQRDKTLKLFAKIEQCKFSMKYGIQTITSFTSEETMLTKINGDYRQFKETVNKVRKYIDSGRQ